MWSHSAYILGLLFGLVGLAVIDKKYSLAFFYDAKRSFKTLGLSMAIFIAWDLLGIVLGIFSDGDGKYRSGLEIFPHFPIEEIFFLVLLTYTTLIVWRLLNSWKENR